MPPPVRQCDNSHTIVFSVGGDKRLEVQPENENKMWKCKNEAWQKLDKCFDEHNSEILGPGNVIYNKICCWLNPDSIFLVTASPKQQFVIRMQFLNVVLQATFPETAGNVQFWNL